MTQGDYEAVSGWLMELAGDIETQKRPGYTRGDDDVLANFKRAGRQAGVTTEQAWAVFFLKHVDAIVSIMTRPDLAVSESPAGRFADAINYLRLGYALYEENGKAAAVTFEAQHTVADALVDAGELPAICRSTPIVTTTQQQGDGFVEIQIGSGSFGYTLEHHRKMGPQC